MTLQELQTPKEHFTIASFDQRQSLSAILSVDGKTPEGKKALEDIKAVFMETFSPISSAVLVDPNYGLPSLEHKKGNSGLLMTLDAYDYDAPKPEDTPKLAENWGVKEIAEHNAAVKFFFYYHPESPEAVKKQALVQKLREETRQHHVPFLVEPIQHPLQGRENEFLPQWYEHHKQIVLDFTSRCDVLKLEYPIPPDEALDEDVGAKRCTEITEISSVPWVMLSRGMPYERYVQALKIAMKNGAKGIAVGRAVWKEIGGMKTPQERFAYIRTTGRDRMLELISIVESV